MICSWRPDVCVCVCARARVCACVCVYVRAYTLERINGLKYRVEIWYLSKIVTPLQS